MMGLNAQAIGPWQEVINDVVFADAPMFRDFFVRNNREDFQQVRADYESWWCSSSQCQS